MTITPSGERPTMSSANEVARVLVQKYIDLRKPATNMKIQKLLYYAWVDYYRLTKKWLFDTPIYAWKFGPVVADVYREYKLFAGMPITYNSVNPPRFSADLDKFLSDFAEKYLDRTALGLVSSTHREGTPWKKYYVPGEKYTLIPFEAIIEMECS